MKQKIIVTGTSGRIGEAIAANLFSGNYSVIGIDKIPGKFTTHICDINDLDQINSIFEGATAIIHTAALHAPHVGKVSDLDFRRVNIDGTKYLAELAIKYKIDRFVFTSTTAIYGYATQITDGATWITEETISQPKTIYHTSKIEAELVLKEISHSSQLKVAIIRMSRCFPEAANLMACYRLHRGVDKRDVAQAHKLALELQNPKGFDVFIVSGMPPFEFNDRFIAGTDFDKILKERCPDLIDQLNDIGYKPPKSIDRIYDPSKAKKVLGWSSHYSYLEVFKQLREDSPEVLLPT